MKKYNITKIILTGLLWFPFLGVSSCGALDDNQVLVSATVDYSITGFIKQNVVFADSNWDSGFWLIKNENSYLVFAKI